MNAKRKGGLGKSFGSLLPKDFNNDILVDPKDRVQKIPINQIKPNPKQPRRHFDQELLKELASSIKRYGILQPLIVSPLNNKNNYVLVAGERRWRAAKMVGQENVPAIVRLQKELEQLEIALIENVQRVDLSPIEQAISIEKLHTQFNFTYKDVAERLGKGISTVNNIVRLLQLPEKAIEALQKNKITEGHARAILSLKDSSEQQHVLLNSVQRHGWSVRQAEQFVTSHKQGVTSKPAVRQRLSAVTPETKRLSKKLAVPVSLRRTAKGGRLEIHFTNDDELGQIINLLEKA
jgi:ParB family chromosome partitioning protein